MQDENEFLRTQGPNIEGYYYDDSRDVGYDEENEDVEYYDEDEEEYSEEASSDENYDDEDEEEYSEEEGQESDLAHRSSSKGKELVYRSEFVHRVSEYPLLHWLRSVYEDWKNSSRLLRFVLERFVERNLPLSLFLATPFTATAFGAYRRMGSPFLAQLDEFGCRQLDYWEESGLVLLPYILLDKTLDITEGSLDYWLPPKNWHSAKLEYAAEDELNKRDYELLTQEGKYLEAAIARFRYLQARAECIASCARIRLRDRLAVLPLALPISDFIGTRLIGALQTAREVISAPGELIHILGQLRNNVLIWVESIGKQTLVLMHVAVDPILNWAQEEGVELKNHLSVSADKALSFIVPASLQIAIRRLFLLFRNFITTGSLNWKKVKKTIRELPSAYEEGEGGRYVVREESTQPPQFEHPGDWGMTRTNVDQDVGPNLQEERKRKSQREILREEMGLEQPSPSEQRGEWQQGKPVGSQARNEPGSPGRLSSSEVRGKGKSKETGMGKEREALEEEELGRGSRFTHLGGGAYADESTALLGQPDSFQDQMYVPEMDSGPSDWVPKESNIFAADQKSGQKEFSSSSTAGQEGEEGQVDMTAGGGKPESESFSETPSQEEEEEGWISLPGSKQQQPQQAQQQPQQMQTTTPSFSTGEEGKTADLLDKTESIGETGEVSLMPHKDVGIQQSGLPSGEGVEGSTSMQQEQQPQQTQQASDIDLSPAIETSSLSKGPEHLESQHMPTWMHAQEGGSTIQQEQQPQQPQQQQSQLGDEELLHGVETPISKDIKEGKKEDRQGEEEDLLRGVETPISKDIKEQQPQQQPEELKKSAIQEDLPRVSRQSAEPRSPAVPKAREEEETKIDTSANLSPSSKKAEPSFNADNLFDKMKSFSHEEESKDEEEEEEDQSLQEESKQSIKDKKGMGQGKSSGAFSGKVGSAVNFYEQLSKPSVQAKAIGT